MELAVQHHYFVYLPSTITYKKGYFAHDTTDIILFISSRLKREVGKRRLFLCLQPPAVHRVFA
jgi:hypothetical protein